MSCCVVSCRVVLCNGGGGCVRGFDAIKEVCSKFIYSSLLLGHKVPINTIRGV